MFPRYHLSLPISLNIGLNRYTKIPLCCNGHARSSLLRCFAFPFGALLRRCIHIFVHFCLAPPDSSLKVSQKTLLVLHHNIILVSVYHNLVVMSRNFGKIHEKFTKFSLLFPQHSPSFLQKFGKYGFSSLLYGKNMLK